MVKGNDTLVLPAKNPKVKNKLIVLKLFPGTIIIDGFVLRFSDAIIMLKGLFTFLFFTLLVSVVSAQSTRDVNRNRTVAPGAQPIPQYESVQRQSKQSGFFARAFKKEQTEVEQFRTNMKKIAKERRKAARLADKPEYNNPIYFGHKKPPIKRPPGKQRFCKECGMKH